MSSTGRWATAFLLLLWWPAADGAVWTTDHQRSSLGFVATYDGVAFKTRFERFGTQIIFDPLKLEIAQFDVTVDVSSVNSRSADRDEGMLGSEWFDDKAFPESRFVSTGFAKTGENAFEVTGRLTVKGVTQEIVLPFTWSERARGARLNGRTVLRRTDFNVGTGEWEKDATIGFEVIVEVDLVLQRSP